MRYLLLALILITLPLAAAVDNLERPYDYEALIAEVTVSSSMLANELGSDAKVSSMEADLSFIPLNTSNQIVLDFKAAALPDANIDTSPESVVFTWDNPREDYLSFNTESRVQIDNKIVKIYKQNSYPLKYPIETLGENYEDYTVATEYIDINDDIRSLASDIIEGETDYYKVVLKLAKWVSENINYTLDTMTADAVQKSSWVLENREGVCDEITNLFISLCRAAKIPSRFIGGVAYSNIDSDFGSHGWAEVYFPGEGWVPVDITFKQVGWVDPTHIRMKASMDSGEPSVNYKWQARETDFTMNPLRVDTKAKSLYCELSPFSRMTIEPLRTEVAPGSYVPFHLKIDNLNEYHLPLSIYIKKAPGLVEDNNRFVVLQPLETKDLFWTAKIPADIEPNTIYTTMIELEDQYGNSAKESITYANGYEFFSEGWAKEQVQRLAPREEKSYLHNIELSCKLDKGYYYAEESATVSCDITNAGNMRLTGLKLCYEANCKLVNLEVAETKQESLTFPLVGMDAGKIKLTAETKNLVKHDYLDLEIIKVPKVVIESFGPEEIGYWDEGKFSMLLNTSSTAYDVNIEINNKWKASIGNLTIPKEIIMPFNPKKVVRKDINVVISYKGKVGKLYETKESYRVDVKKIPLFVKFILWVESLF